MEVFKLVGYIDAYEDCVEEVGLFSTKEKAEEYCKKVGLDLAEDLGKVGTYHIIPVILDDTSAYDEQIIARKTHEKIESCSELNELLSTTMFMQALLLTFDETFNKIADLLNSKQFESLDEYIKTVPFLTDHGVHVVFEKDRKGERVYGVPPTGDFLDFPECKIYYTGDNDFRQEFKEDFEIKVFEYTDLKEEYIRKFGEEVRKEFGF